MTGQRALVSIIIPNYNYARYLGEAIDSALAQTYSPVEVIVVDDGSTDGSRSVIEGYGGSIRPVYQGNAGLPSARNAGIRQAQGDYFVFLDADDLLLPDAVAKLSAGFAAHPDSGIVFGGSELVDSAGIRISFHANVPRVFTWEEFLLANYILVPEAMVSRLVIQRIGLFNPAFLQCEDYDFWIRSARHFPIRHLDVLVARIRMHEMNLSRDRVRQLTWEARILHSHADGSPLSRRSLAQVYHRLAYECRVAGLAVPFARSTMRALRYRPGYWKNWLYLAYVPISLIVRHRRKPGEGSAGVPGPRAGGPPPSSPDLCDAAGEGSG